MFALMGQSSFEKGSETDIFQLIYFLISKMKKLLIISFLLCGIVLTGCSSNQTSTSTNLVTTTSKSNLTTDQLFTKNQECSNFVSEMEKERESVAMLAGRKALPMWYLKPIEENIETNNYPENDNIYKELENLWIDITDINWRIAIDEIFYSPTLDSCLYSTIFYTDFWGGMISKDMQIFDFYNKENIVWHIVWKKIFSTFCHIANNKCGLANTSYRDQIQQLKWE